MLRVVRILAFFVKISKVSAMEDTCRVGVKVMAKVTPGTR